MKRISFFLAATLLLAPALLRAQDAAVEERLNRLTGQMNDLIEAKEAQNKRIEELARAIREIQDQQNKPNASYASQEDVKRLTEKLQEIDRKRQDDNEKILKELDKLGTTLRTSPGPKSSSSSGNGGGDTTSNRPEKGYEYVIKEKDTLSAIAKAYSDQGVKVTVAQIQSANPGLKAESLKPGTTIFIPKPKQ